MGRGLGARKPVFRGFQPGKTQTRLLQGLHRLEKYLNIHDCLEKSLKIKFALKKTQRP